MGHPSGKSANGKHFFGLDHHFFHVDLVGDIVNPDNDTFTPIGHQRIDEVSGPGESHPRTLAEPGVNLSAHRAPIIQPLV